MKNELQKKRLMFHELLIKMKNGVIPELQTRREKLALGAMR